MDIANGQIGQWLHDIAHQRIHGTTGEKTQLLLAQERQSLQPLPVKPPTDSLLPVLTRHQVIPTESLQHPLSVDDPLLGVTS
ncbi:hypothetical protein [Candidatus Fukatsuia endosymbiont of Tuberolachnus salignus]|uniref:hypothetical protein n=1 Tax=Candidatus Fukatsuia endosymbiont of Tuberolachnus salignus TaxID=3077957 RepID=UPI003CC7A53A